MQSLLPEPKMRSATLEDVARIAGVSKMTVSRVLNGQRRNSPHEKSILEAVKELNFEVNPHAKRLSSGREHGSIGFFVVDIDLGVGTLKMRRIQSLLTHAGYRVPLYSAGSFDHSDDRTDAKLVAELRLMRPEAIIYASHHEGQALTELRRFQSEGGVVVCYHSQIDLDCDQVIFDKEDNTYQSTRHLLELGHQQIGLYIDGSIAVQETDRYKGFVRALDEFGVEPRPQWLVRSGDFDSGSLQEGGGVLLAKQFLSWKERPTAMCVVNDNSAVAFISILGQAGVRVPYDLSVVGHDDLPIAAVFPIPLTTVSHPVLAVSNGVTDLLLSRLRGDYVGPSRKVIARGELIVRKSTAPFHDG